MIELPVGQLVGLHQGVGRALDLALMTQPLHPAPSQGGLAGPEGPVQEDSGRLLAGVGQTATQCHGCCLVRQCHHQLFCHVLL